MLGNESAIPAESKFVAETAVFRCEDDKNVFLVLTWNVDGARLKWPTLFSRFYSCTWPLATVSTGETRSAIDRQLFFRRPYIIQELFKYLLFSSNGIWTPCAYGLRGCSGGALPMVSRAEGLPLSFGIVLHRPSDLSEYWGIRPSGAHINLLGINMLDSLLEAQLLVCITLWPVLPTSSYHSTSQRFSLAASFPAKHHCIMSERRLSIALL